MSDRKNINPIADDNRDALRRLTRIVTRSQGFSLSIALCNYRVLQECVLQELRSQLANEGLPETAIAILELKSDAQTLLAPVQKLMEDVQKLPSEQRPKVLMVLGLDAVIEVEAVLKSANRVREEFANCLEFPMALWLNDRTQDILTREASDLANWTTAGAIEFRLEAKELITLLQDSIQAMFDRFVDLGKRKAARYEIADSLQQFELMTAIVELENQGTEIDMQLRANLDFAFGCIAFTEKAIDRAKELFQKSLTVWRDGDQLKQAVCLLQLGMCDRTKAFRRRYDKQQFYQTAKQYLSESIAILRQLERWDLMAEYIVFLTATVEELASRGEGNLWQELEALANEAIALHKSYPNQIRESHDRAMLASVNLAKKGYTSAREFAESALALYREGEALKLPNLAFSERYGYGKYEIWLARALDGLGDRQGAIARLENVKASWTHQYDAQVYVVVLEELRSLYTATGLYLEAFETKQHQRSVEQQYGLRAFIGAGTLNPKRETSNPDLYTSIADQSDEIAQEIAASGRLQDVQNLVDRIGQPRFPLTVIHGDSGAGKSSILSGGLIPALRSRSSFDGRKVLVLLVKNYKDWSAAINHQLQEYFGDRRPDLDPIHHFHRNIEENYLTVIIFDQFEDFFFKKQEFSDRLPFYKFLKACLHTDFVRVVLSLREDYLHYLLECDRAVNLEKVENDILGKQVRYYLGDFTQEQARQVIEALTLRSQLRLDADLCDRLVEDLSGEQSRILPIELQVVGAQLESENPPILTLSKYLELTAGNEKRKPSEVLVERWLENVVKDCGVLNEELAERVLYALTGNEEKRPQKTLTELGLELLPSTGASSPPSPQFWGDKNLQSPPELGDLGGEISLSEKSVAKDEGNLSLVIAVLVGSGLVFRVSGTPEDRFQLIHDYLVSFIRKKYEIDVMAELREERKRRERAEKEKDILSLANSKANRRIRTGSVFLGIASIVALGISIYAGKTFQDSQTALAVTQIEKQSAEAERLFKTQEFQALLPATRSAQNLKKLIKDTQQINQYPSVSPLGALQLILRDSREIFQFQATSIVFAPDGKRFATSSIDGTARIWDENGKELAILKGHQSEVMSVVFSSDGKRLATSSRDGTARIWDENGKELAILRGHQGAVFSVVFAPDGKRLATRGIDGTARIWNEDGEELLILKGHQGAVFSVVFAPDGKRLATSGRDGTARIWNEDGKELLILKGNQGGISSVVFAPDGKRLATSSSDGTARIWDENSKELAILKGHQGELLSVVFAPDSKHLATSGIDGTARIWDENGKDLAILKGHQGYVGKVVFAPDSKRLATSGGDGTVRIWDENGKELTILRGHQRYVDKVVFASDGKRLATSGTDGTARIWDENGKELVILKGHKKSVLSVVFASDGKRLATSSSDGTARIWDENSKELAILKGHQGTIFSVVFAPDGKRLATSGIDGTARIWDENGTELAILKGHQGLVDKVVFAPDGKRLATRGIDGTARVWDENGTELAILKGHQGAVLSVVFAPDGKRLATSSIDGTARIWDKNGTELAILKGHQGFVLSVVFAPDGKRLATSGIDGTVRIWDENGKELVILKGHKKFVGSVVFAPDGKRLATSGSDGTVRIWDENSKELAILKGYQGYGGSVVFAPDGKRLATSGSDNIARIWDDNGRQIAEYEGNGFISNDFQFIATITKSDPSIVKLWRIQALNEMLVSACSHLRPYLITNTNLLESDKHICDDIP